MPMAAQRSVLWCFGRATLCTQRMMNSTHFGRSELADHLLGVHKVGEVPACIEARLAAELAANAMLAKGREDVVAR